MITIKVKGMEGVQAFLKKIPLGIKTAAGRTIAEYLVGDASHGLKHEPYYKYVNRQAGFGAHGGYMSSDGYVPVGYVSAKQHRYVMAAIADGKIKPGQDNRTHDLSNSWRVTGEAPRYAISGGTTYAEYVMGDTKQTQMHNLIGWRRIGQNISDNINGAFRKALQVVNRWIESQR